MAGSAALEPESLGSMCCGLSGNRGVEVQTGGLTSTKRKTKNKSRVLGLIASTKPE